MHVTVDSLLTVTSCALYGHSKLYTRSSSQARTITGGKSHKRCPAGTRGAVATWVRRVKFQTILSFAKQPHVPEQDVLQSAAHITSTDSYPILNCQLFWTHIFPFALPKNIVKVGLLRAVRRNRIRKWIISWRTTAGKSSQATLSYLELWLAFLHLVLHRRRT